MAEPIPSAHEGGGDETNKATNAEDRKAAAALDALNANAMSQDNGEGQGSKQPSAADQEALKGAMGRLEIESKKGMQTDGGKKKEEVRKEAEVKKKVKVSQEDVQFLVAELDLSKARATELLRGADGNLGDAVRGFVVGEVKG